jgi:hypothetical protein
MIILVPSEVEFFMCSACKLLTNRHSGRNLVYEKYDNFSKLYKTNTKKIQLKLIYIITKINLP